MASGIAEPMPSVLRQTPASSLTAYAGMDKLPHPMDGNGIAYLGTGHSDQAAVAFLDSCRCWFSAANALMSAALVKLAT